MNIWVESGDKKITSRIKNRFTLSRNSPGFVLVYGGDGTLLIAERKFPRVPKIFIHKKPPNCHNRKMCYSVKHLSLILDKLSSGDFKIREKPKAEALFRNKKLKAMNEIQIHNKIPYKALRFSLSVGNKKLGRFMGDGLIAATPYGSTAYFSVIGGKPFRNGIKIGFNNIVPTRKPVALGKKTAKVKIIREQAWLISDNDPRIVSLKPGDVVSIRESDEKMRFVELRL